MGGNRNLNLAYSGLSTEKSDSGARDTDDGYRITWDG